MIKIMKYREVYRLLPVLAAALMLTGLSVRGASASERVSPEDRAVFKAALEDTETATQAEIFRGLLAVVPGPDRLNYQRLGGDGITWKDPQNKAFSPVQVVSFMTLETYREYYEAGMGKQAPLTKSLWVTVVPEMKNFFLGEP